MKSRTFSRCALGYGNMGFQVSKRLIQNGRAIDFVSDMQIRSMVGSPFVLAGPAGTLPC